MKHRERLILCQNLRSATSNTPDCELMPSVYTTAVGLNDRADIMHVFTAYCYVLSRGGATVFKLGGDKNYYCRYFGMQPRMTVNIGSVVWQAACHSVGSI